MDPIAQRLPIHAADPGRFAAILAVAHRGQRQQPTALVCVLRPLGQTPKLGRRIVLPKRDRRSHGQNLHAILNQPSSDSGIPIRESAVATAGITSVFMGFEAL